MFLPTWPSSNVTIMLCGNCYAPLVYLALCGNMYVMLYPSVKDRYFCFACVLLRNSDDDHIDRNTKTRRIFWKMFRYCLQDDASVTFTSK
jgi:hypothetical protein